MVFFIVLIAMFGQIVNEEPIYINQSSPYPASTKLQAMKDDPAKYNVSMIFSIE